MTSEIAKVALDLFEARGFGAVTVEEVADAAQISIRTFYRYYASKDELLVEMIRQRARAIATALAERPLNELPLHSVHLAVERALSIEDPTLVKRWIHVVMDTPGVLRTTMGASILEINQTIADFLGNRLGVPADSVVPSTLAAAIGAVIHNAQTRWHFRGGEFVTTVSEALGVLEDGIGTDRMAGSRSEPASRQARHPRR
jgi:AcrR family transcriptional regulator